MLTETSTIDLGLNSSKGLRCYQVNNIVAWENNEPIDWFVDCSWSSWAVDQIFEVHPFHPRHLLQLLFFWQSLFPYPLQVLPNLSYGPKEYEERCKLVEKRGLAYFMQCHFHIGSGGTLAQAPFKRLPHKGAPLTLGLYVSFETKIFSIQIWYLEIFFFDILRFHLRKILCWSN